MPFLSILGLMDCRSWDSFHQLKTLFNPLEASLMKVQTMAHDCQVAMDKGQFPAQSRDIFL